MSFYPSDQIIVFIDGPNLHAAAKALNVDIDFRRLLKAIGDRGRLIRAYYYTAVTEGDQYSTLRPLLDWLNYNGFVVVSKPMVEYTDAQGWRRAKGNMGVEIAVDMLELARTGDHFVLFSGDGNFTRLVKDVQRMGCRVTVVSTLQPSAAFISDELRRQCDTFVDLAQMLGMVGREEPKVANRLKGDRRRS